MFCPQSAVTGSGGGLPSSSATVLPIQKPSCQSSNIPPNYGHQIQQPNPSSASASYTTQHCHCNCERPMALVVCCRCGNDLVGRVLSPCPMHPRRIALMDLRECPRPQCRSVHLAELQMAKSNEE